MGGSSSKTSFESNTEIVGSSVQEQAQSCSHTATAENRAYIVNSNVHGWDQEASVTVDGDCLGTAVNNTDFMSDLKQQVGQSLDKQGVALTQWADAGDNEQDVSINSAVRFATSSHVVQDCVVKANAVNTATVINSAVDGFKQIAGARGVGQCVQNSSQSMRAASTIATISNQTQKVVSENPLDFIAKAIGAFSQGIWLFVIVIVVVGLVFGMIKGLGRHTAAKQAITAPPAATPPRATA